MYGNLTKCYVRKSLDFKFAENKINVGESKISFNENKAKEHNVAKMNENFNSQ
jgi:hypothetical protein